MSIKTISTNTLSTPSSTHIETLLTNKTLLARHPQKTILQLILAIDPDTDDTWTRAEIALQKRAVYLRERYPYPRIRQFGAVVVWGDKVRLFTEELCGGVGGGGTMMIPWRDEGTGKVVFGREEVAKGVGERWLTEVEDNRVEEGEGKVRGLLVEMVGDEELGEDVLVRD
ncbi:uncharacterized protein BP01DRAFT_364339 [Aspergillus saccharolyticus JOP 1030-1]|uniref:Uncharacterized protein n=1 Tax=Aspergillus saccharolyticus JOP 1030-1 TaxID=1450539 RepID=A0A318ZGT5_9EURO|nr:hypothetical protein BP01DRAFT_364339 [Aspergillus saccharolyticus JOP 1030-1]PYH46766.1 hypothetical protein BP01DRAFT_364339 [Aspergillus saccharolyticus JOP 1030-1]